MKTVMKALFVIFLLLLGNKIAAQTFYDMLRETMDSTYRYIIERNVKFKILEKLKYNNIYEPYGYEPSKMLQTLKLKKKKYTYRYNLVGDYDMRLRKDTILIYSCGTTFHKRHRYKNKFWEARNRISNKKRPSKMCNNINELIFVYNKNGSSGIWSDNLTK